jgi:PiT family inorganic phosphate transporter
LEAYYIYVGLALLFGLFMAWGIGANDVANAMATSIGSGALTFKQALIVAAVFEFAGALLAGGEVTSTIRKGMVDSSLFADNPDILILGMLASLLAAGTWLLIASIKGWPVSTTHSIVGAIVGFAVVAVGFEAIAWGKVGTIAMSWVISPLIAGIISYGVFYSIKKLILVQKKPFRLAKKYAPYYVLVAVTLIVLVTIYKGLKHVGLSLTLLEAYSIALLSAVPIPDPIKERQRKRIILEGDVPSPANPPSGCHFHTRCPIAQERCKIEDPPFEEKEPGHWVACHFTKIAQEQML